MSRIKLADVAQIAEIVGAVAVVVSLIYLARQVQHNTSAVKGASTQSVATTDANALLTIAADSTLSEIVRLGHLDASKLTTADAFRYELYMRQFWLSMQNIQQQSQLGLIDSSVWRSYVSVICGMWARPGPRQTWSGHAAVLSPAFVAVVEACKTP